MQGIDESQLQHPRLRSPQAPEIMKRGFYTIMAAQFFSSLADNALLIAAIAQLLELDGPASILLGTVLGGALISPPIASLLLAIDVPHIDTGIETPAEAAILVISTIYVIAAIFNLFIPDTGVRYGQQQTNPALLMRDFYVCFVTLWKDKLGQISLSVTTLFWGAGATLQFLVLQWAAVHLGLPLDKAAILQRITAVSVALRAVV